MAWRPCTSATSGRAAYGATSGATRPWEERRPSTDAQQQQQQQWEEGQDSDHGADEVHEVSSDGEHEDARTQAESGQLSNNSSLAL